VLRVLSGAGVVQAGRRRTGQSESIVEFAVGEDSGVTGDGRVVARGALFPRVGFSVTNLKGRAKKVVRFYNRRSSG
jgi:hypothetical protein